MRDIDWTRTKLLAEIDRLRAELAELKSWMDDNDDSFVAELHEARAETSRLRVDHATAYANTVALAQECARLRAELSEAKDALVYELRYHTIDQNHILKQDERIEIAEAALGRVRELCELAIRDRDSGVGLEDIVNAIERVEK